MRSEFNRTGEELQQERTSSAGSGAEGGTGALEALDRFFGSGKGTSPQDPVASDGPGREAPCPAGKSDAAGQDGDRGEPPQPEQTADAHRSGSIDDAEGTVSDRGPATAVCAASGPGAEAAHGGDDRSSVGGGGDPEDRGSGRSGPQFEVVHPDDPGFLDEFGAVKEGEQGIFDWFALETKDPLDVEDDMFSEAADLPSKLAERESGSRRPAVGVADRRGDRPEAGGQRSFLDRSGPEAVRRDGVDASRSSGEASGAVADSADAGAGSGSKANPSGEVPQDRSAGDFAAGRASGGAPRLRRWSTGWPRRGLAVVALAVVGGVALMQLTGDAGFRRALETAVTGTTGPEYGNVPAPLPEDILSNRSLADSGRTSEDAGSIVQLAGRMGNAVPSLAERTVPGDADRFRLQLVPVDLNPAGPLAVNAPDMVEWDRLFSLLGQPVGTLSANFGTGAGPFESDQPETRPGTAGTGGSVRTSVEFTADDGFGLAASGPVARLNSPGDHVDYLGPDLPPVGVADDGGTPSGMSASPPAETGRAESATGRKAETATGFESLEERVAGIEGRLAAVNRKVDELRAQMGAAILRRSAALSLSPFVAPDGLAGSLEAHAAGNDATYVIKSGKGGPAPIAALAEVKVGDRIDGFGKVLDIVEYGDRGRLLVMEEGSVYLN